MPAPALARPWRVRTVDAPGRAYTRAVDVLPGGRVAALVQRRAADGNRLELRTGRRVRLLDRSPRGFFNADLRHDRYGRPAAVWSRYLEDNPHAFAWTAATGRQQVSGLSGSPTPSLAVAPTGRAAVAYWSTDGVFVARGTTSGKFGAAEKLDSAAFPGPPGVGVTNGGRVVVAWIGNGMNLILRAATGAAPFSPRQMVTLRPRAAGTSILRESPKVAMTSHGRAVVVVTTVEGKGEAVTDSRVEAAEWPLASPGPSGAATFSRGLSAGTADVVAQGGDAVIAWTQRPKSGPRALWVTRWTPKGIQRPNVYDTHALGLPVLLTPGRRGAVDAYYRAGGPRWFTVRLTAAGLYRGTSTLTPPGQQVGTIDVAASGRRRAAGWTAAEPRPHAQIARP